MQDSCDVIVIGAGMGGLTSAVPDKDAKLVITCSGDFCPASEYAAEAAVALGYTNVYRFQGGWVEWDERGNELQKGEEPGPCVTPQGYQ